MKKALICITLILLAFSLCGCSFLGGLKSEDNSLQPDSSVEFNQNELEASQSSQTESSEIEEEASEVEESSEIEDESSEVEDEKPATVFQIDLGDVVVSALAEEDFYRGNNVIYRYEETASNCFVTYTAKSDITDFRILEYDEGVALCIGGVEATVDKVNAGQSINSKQYSHDISINTGFSFVNSMGVTEYYTIYSTGNASYPYVISAYEVNQRNAYSTVIEHTAWETVLNCYAYFDLDGDCDNELIIDTGMSEAERQFVFYDVIDGIATKIGETAGGNSGLVSDGEYLIVHGGHMGEEWASKVIYSNGTLGFENVPLDSDPENFEGYTTWPYDIITYNY